MDFLALWAMFLVGITSLVFVEGYSSGAPSLACTDMTPRHGFDVQTSTSPYKITVASSYSCNEDVRVTIDGASFKGFFCQSRTEDNQRTTGSLTAEGNVAMTSKCDPSVAALTQADAGIKTSAQFRWKPEATESAYIVCTFVQDKSTYWVQQKSTLITYSGCPQPTPFPTGKTNTGSGNTRNTTGNGEDGNDGSGAANITALIYPSFLCCLICIVLNRKFF